MKHSTKITILMIGLFLAAQIIGLFVLNSYIDVPKTKETGKLSWESLPNIAGIAVERPEIRESISFVYIIAAVVIGTLMVLLLMRFRTILLWKLWYLLAIGITMTIALGAFMSSVAASVLGFVLALGKTFRPNIIVHNLTELFVYSGLAVIFVPVINITAMFILLGLISVYDMYAVWKSGHMIKMAKAQAKSGIFAGLLLPYKLPKGSIGISKAKMKKIKVRVAVLGGGDIGFPLLFAGVVMKTFGFWHAMIVPPFVALSLLLLLLFGKKEKFYPAMPFLSLGCLAGYLAVLAVGMI